MHIDRIVPDVGLETPSVAPIPRDSAAIGFGQLVDVSATTLAGADVAERAFVNGTGGLQEMIVERARADISLAVAASGAQRAAQALNTLLGMQI